MSRFQGIWFLDDSKVNAKKQKESLFIYPTHTLFISFHELYLLIMITFDYQYFLGMNRIKEALDRKEIKQIGLAEQLGKKNSYVQNRQQPRLEVLNDIPKILDVDVVVSNKNK